MKAPSSKGRHHRGIREGTARPGAGSSASAELRRQGRSGVRVGGAEGLAGRGPARVRALQKAVGGRATGRARREGAWSQARAEARAALFPGWSVSHASCRCPNVLPAPRFRLAVPAPPRGLRAQAVCPAPGSIRHPLAYAPAALADVAGRSPDGSPRAPTASSLACELSRSRDCGWFSFCRQHSARPANGTCSNPVV